MWCDVMWCCVWRQMICPVQQRSCRRSTVTRATALMTRITMTTMMTTRKIRQQMKPIHSRQVIDTVLRSDIEINAGVSISDVVTGAERGTCSPNFWVVGKLSEFFFLSQNFPKSEALIISYVENSQLSVEIPSKMCSFFWQKLQFLPFCPHFNPRRRWYKTWHCGSVSAVLQFSHRLLTSVITVPVDLKLNLLVTYLLLIDWHFACVHIKMISRFAWYSQNYADQPVLRKTLHQWRLPALRAYWILSTITMCKAGQRRNCIFHTCNKFILHSKHIPILRWKLKVKNY